MPLVTIRGMENLIPTTWRADTTTEDTLAYAMQAVSGIAVPVATKATHPSNPNKLRNLRLALSGLAPGMWATNHLEETRHYTGWNYIAIRAIAIQAAQAKLSAVVDPEAIRYAHLSRGKRHRLLKQLAPGRRKPFMDNDGDGSPDLQPLPRRHPLLQLLRRPNIEQSGASLRFAMAQQLCLTGSALVWIVRNGLGVPRELYVVPTALATPMPPSHLFPRGAYRVLPLSSFGMVSDDEWNSNGSLGSLLMTGGVLDARDVKAVRWPHPLYPSDGQSSLAAGSLQIDVAEQADRARWAAMKNSHRPGFVFSWEENSQPGEEEMDAFRVGFNADNGGSQNTGKHLVLPEGMKADRMDRPPTEMDFVNAYGQLRDACLALQGVPPIACGITEAGSYAAFYAALKQFTELTMQPTLDLIAEEWTEALGEYHDDGTGAIEIHLKAKAIEDEALLDSRKSLHISARDITINESRAMSKPPLPPVPWGDVQVGSDIAAQEQQKQQAAAQGSKPPGTPGVAAGTPADDNEPEPQDATHTGTREPPRDAAPGRQDRVAPHLLKGMGPHTFASTQIAFPRHLARPILEFGRKLPASILATEGRETEIHCTVLYGLHATSVDPVDTVLSGQPSVRLLLGKLDVFEAGTHDVLVIAVQSPDLHRLHQRLRSNLPNSNKYPQYKPHVTIAYLKPGEGKVFKGDPSFEGISLIASEIIFSAASGERTVIKLGGPLTKSGQHATETAPYGYCPQCGAPGVATERRLDGDSICANGHTYSRRDAVRSKSGQWEEDKHPRDHGKFSSKPGTDGDADKPGADKKQPPEAFYDMATQLVDSLADGSIAPDKAAEAVEELESQVILHVDVIGDRYIDKANSFHGEGITGHPDAETIWGQYARHVTETQEEISYAAAIVRTTLGEGDVEAAQEAVEAFEQTHKEAVARIEDAASDLNYGLNQLAEELELPAKEACSDLDDMDRDDANEQAEVINEELAGDGNPFRVQFDEGSESWEWFIPEPEKPASKRLRRLRVKRLRVKHLRKTFDESKINRAEDGRFGDKPGQHDSTDKPAGKKPSARTEWASTVAKIDADHDAKLEAYQAQTAKIETAHVAAYRDWQRQCESMEAENGKARAEWQERKEERRTHAAKLDALHYQDIDQQAEIEQIETLKGNLTALDTSDDAAARERFSMAAEALPTTYRAAFLSAFQERSDADLASAGMPDPRRERLKVSVEKMASALTAKAEKAKQAALAVASAHEAIEALGEPEFDTDDAGAAAYDEWQHKLDAAEATLETATKLFDDALEAMEGVWEKFAQKAADARDSAIDAILARIQSEEESDREPEELSEEQLPPEPEEPEYPPEPERPADPPEPEESEEDPAKR